MADDDKADIELALAQMAERSDQVFRHFLRWVLRPEGSVNPTEGEGIVLSYNSCNALVTEYQSIFTAKRTKPWKRPKTDGQNTNEKRAKRK